MIIVTTSSEMELSSRGSGESSLQMSSMRMRMSVSLSTTGMENLDTRYQISCAIYREMNKIPSLSPAQWY